MAYQLAKSGSGKYHSLVASASSAYVKRLTMYGFADCIDFEKKNRDGSTFGSAWNLSSIAVFNELKNYQRIQDMPKDALKKLAARICLTLFDTKSKMPCILEELVELQEAQKSKSKTGDIKFPKISKQELKAIDLW